MTKSSKSKNVPREDSPTDDTTLEKDEEDLKSEQFDKNLEKYGIYAAFSFLVIFVVIGLPVWWRTTAVYRVSLPYNDIAALDNFNIVHTITVKVVLLDKEESEMGVNAMLMMLHKRDGVGYKVEISEYTATERAIVDAATTVAELRGIRRSAVGVLTLLQLPASSPALTKSVYVTRRRTLYFKGESAVTLDKLVKVVDSCLGSSSLDAASREAEEQKWKLHTSHKRVQGAQGYNIIMVLINPQAERWNVSWNLQPALKAYLMPFVSKLSVIGEFNVSGRVLYQQSLRMYVRKHEESGDSRIHEEHLSHLINPVEALLNSYVTNNPSLYFVTYIPPEQDTPLYMVRADGQRGPHNAFLSPRWGGFYIYNADKTQTDIEVDTRKLFTVFITQMRLLLGLDNPVSDELVEYERLDYTALRDWEQDFLYRLYASDYSNSAKTSLQSLSALLGEIRNIVINDEVGSAVYKAVQALHECSAALHSGDLTLTLTAARRAYLAADKAFFDPSMLALLYFPDDQKYAVYVPLFLPVGFPVLMSMKKIYLWFKSRNVKTKTE